MSKEIHNLGDIVRPGASGDRLSYIEHGETPRHWTLQEFNQAIDQTANQLSDRGLAPGSRIGILGMNSAAYLIVYFASMRAGLTPVPINYRLPADTIEFIVEDSHISLVFADKDHADLIPKGLESAPLDAVAGTAAANPEGAEPFRTVRPDPETACKILYTSGSTGRPKGTVLDHGGQIWAITQSLADTPASDSRVMVVAPYYHKNGLYFATYAIASGATVVSLPRFEPRAYLEAAAAHRCDWLTGIPTMFAMLLREADLIRTLDLSHVRRINIGSAPLSESLAARIRQAFPRAALMNGYGATEAGPLIFGEHPDGLPRPALSVGHPAPGIDCRLDGDGNPDEGVLHLRAPSMMREYLNQPDLTRQKVVDGWYNTGDLFRRDPQGFYFFVGRADDMFVCGGENIYPAEVERLLERHPQVAQAAVVGAPDDIKGEVPIGFVVLKDPDSASEEELKRFALTHGPAYSHPRAIVFLDRLPVGGTHKIDRRTLLRDARQIARQRRPA